MVKKKPAGKTRKMLPTQAYCWGTYSRLVKLNVLRFERVGIDLVDRKDHAPEFWLWVMTETGGIAVNVMCDEDGYGLVWKEWFNNDSRKKWAKRETLRMGYEDQSASPDKFIADLCKLKLPADDWSASEPPGYEFSWK